MSQYEPLRELTLRGCILAALITVIFTASNIYLGLKVGLTFSSAIPAAVISMAILRLMRNSTILENCTVQTFASSAGTLSAIIFVLPGLVMLGFWTGFPFWQTAMLCMLGGLLGVMYTIPLRRALVVESDLPYPEGVAAAEVLKVGCRSSQRQNTNTNDQTESGAKAILYGSILSAGYALLSGGVKLLTGTLTYFTRIGGMIFGLSSGVSFALLGAGYLIGIRVAISILIGLIISWGIGVPFLSHGIHIAQHASVAQLAAIADHLWSSQIRFIGVGAISVAAVWTILLLMKPIIQGVRSAIDALAQRRENNIETVPRVERDIPINTVMIIAGFLILPMLALFGYFIGAENLPISSGLVLSLVVISVFVTLFLGFLVSAISGYMAGITGSSNSPISGIGILAVLICALIVTTFMSGLNLHSDSMQLRKLAVALVLFMTASVVAVACISNDNLQDLKTGHLVGATPWRQQVALMMGVVVGALVIPPILSLIYNAYGFAGAPLPHPGMLASNTLAAPQATLMSTLAQGIISHHMHWHMVLIGAGIAIALIAIDGLILRPLGLMRLSVISVGIGLYLPMSVDIPLVAGAVLSYAVNRYRRRHQEAKGEAHEQRGVLMASGLIVGESLFGVVMAGIIGFSGNQAPLALVGAHFATASIWLGLAATVGLIGVIYRYIR